MPTFRRLRPADYRVMPWKNGLGTTTEIAVHPPGAGIDAFTWRVSIADLGASGPFSKFAGYDRVLIQIEGAPMTLSHEGGVVERLRLLAPYRFAGELDTHGALEAPPARDFNVMVRREAARAEVVVHELSAGGAAMDEGRAETRLLHVLRGAVEVEGGDREECAAGETVIVSGAGRVVITAGVAGAVVILAAIEAPR